LFFHGLRFKILLEVAKIKGFVDLEAKFPKKIPKFSTSYLKHDHTMLYRSLGHTKFSLLNNFLNHSSE